MPKVSFFIIFGILRRILKTNLFIFMVNFIDNQPNAGKLISSLRNTGYDSYSAIEDIIDNSIDAHAREIYITVETIQWELRIMIADNGTWMSYDILDQALKLWSITDKTEISDLWKFWMWLCTASISMSKRLEVVTKEKWWTCLYSCQDLDTIESENRFIKELRNANGAEESIFSEILKNSDSWTLIVLTKIDRLSDKNTTQFAWKLSDEIWQTFRKFIDSWIKISVNWKFVSSIDPLFLQHEGTGIYSDEEYELPNSITLWKKESIRVKIVTLPEFSQEKARQLKVWVNSQWFYILRNNREIDRANTLKLWQKDPHANRIRIELSFNANLDDVFWVRFNKDGVNPNQSLTDFLKQEVWWQISSIIRILKKQKASDPSSKIDHSDSESVIAQKAKLLITPESIIEKRNPRKEKNENEEVSQNEEKEQERRNFHNTKTSPQWMWARFKSTSMWREGVLYECEQEWKIIVICWNTDHPFYERMMLENKENKNITSAIDYLIFSLASAELKSINDENVELLSNIKSIMSSNLRSLLS